MRAESPLYPLPFYVRIIGIDNDEFRFSLCNRGESTLTIHNLHRSHVWAERRNLRGLTKVEHTVSCLRLGFKPGTGLIARVPKHVVCEINVEQQEEGQR